MVTETQNAQHVPSTPSPIKSPPNTATTQPPRQPPPAVCLLSRLALLVECCATRAPLPSRVLLARLTPHASVCISRLTLHVSRCRLILQHVSVATSCLTPDLVHISATCWAPALHTHIYTYACLLRSTLIARHTSNSNDNNTTQNFSSAAGGWAEENDRCWFRRSGHCRPPLFVSLPGFPGPSTFQPPAAAVP